jgi:hypothetical protein
MHAPGASITQIDIPPSHPACGPLVRWTVAAVDTVE